MDGLFAELDLVMPGDLVVYHGSIDIAHGLYTAEPCACQRCVIGDRRGSNDPRYTLTPIGSGARLHDVRRQSIDHLV
ncbi:hypothetical protein [Streptomyces sp. C10-9-1]|uniref:hypothetical protein n=1 Tax=Streptomyces sp. C10-9-1 TaxID=1859285 RepID=UPI003F4A53CF